MVLVVVFAILAASLCNAQPAAPSQLVRFTVFSATPIADLGFVPRPNAAPQKLAFQPTARSARYEYRGPMPLRFVDAQGAVVAEASIPPGIRDALLLFSRAEPAAGENRGPRYQVAVIDDGAARHGSGGLGVINLSGLALAGTINDQRVALKSGLNPPIAVGRSARITLTTTFKNRTYQSYTGTATLAPNQRALLILFPPFHAGALEVQSRLLIDQPPRAQ